VINSSKPLDSIERTSAFDFSLTTRTIFGAGALSQLGELACEYGAKQVLLVTDQGLAKAGHEERAVQSLKQAGLQVVIFDGVCANPTTEDVDHTLQVARQHQIDFIVGLGGGSSMDCAKGVNFLLTNGGEIEDYWGVGKATKPMLPFIAIPTTSGTGSEAQSFALIAKPETHMKMACGDKKAAAKVAILDPELTATMPHAVASVTAVDALSHAVETYVTKKRTPVSTMFSMQAWRLLIQAFPGIFQNEPDIEARGQMLLGAHWAGAAIEQSMLGATHALANPLSAHFNTVHGVAVGLMLPHVVRFNQNVVGHLYGELAEEAGLCSADAPEASEKLAQFIQQLVAMTGNPTSLNQIEIDRNLFPQLAQEAAEQWTGNFNPREVQADLMQELYECAWRS